MRYGTLSSERRWFGGLGSGGTAALYTYAVLSRALYRLIILDKTWIDGNTDLTFLCAKWLSCMLAHRGVLHGKVSLAVFILYAIEDCA